MLSVKLCLVFAQPRRGLKVINTEKAMDTATYVGAFYPAPNSKLLLPSNASKQIRISNPKNRYARTRIASSHSRSTRVRSEHGFRMGRRQFLLSSSTLGLGFSAMSAAKPVALAGDTPNEPVELRGPVTLLVKRPNPKRTAKEKEEAEEIVWVQNIEATMADVPTFRVFINLPEANAGTSADSPHFAGSFVDFDRSKRKNIRLSYKVGISECLENLDAAENESIFVTLVPGSRIMPKTPIIFSSIKIDYDSK
uniref:TSA: Wollemia nobilis Ref_Wollemi_Transcript_14050_927 transcribed RNA sequence n=1 Tax=Wollemia nobilis TaxID=56998 RepID=A0A0C9S718_9CONI